MGSIGQSLQRKLGPLPVWAWALIAGIGLYVIRNRNSGANQSLAAQNQQAAAAASANQQNPVVLGPGESVYDPGTGVVTTPQTPVNTNRQDNSFWQVVLALIAAENRNKREKLPPKGGGHGHGGHGHGGTNVHFHNRPPRKHHHKKLDHQAGHGLHGRHHHRTGKH